MNAIFAVNSINGFGTGSDMPWPRNKLDLSRFRELTTGHTVIMGSNTWLSDMPKPLPNRRNCVLSSDLDDVRCEIFRNIEHLLQNLKQSENVYVIGGAAVLWSLRPYIKRVYLTRFHSSDPSTVTMNVDRYLDGFSLSSRQKLDDHDFDIYDILS